MWTLRVIHSLLVGVWLYVFYLSVFNLRLVFFITSYSFPLVMVDEEELLDFLVDSLESQQIWTTLVVRQTFRRLDSCSFEKGMGKWKSIDASLPLNDVRNEVPLQTNIMPFPFF